MIEHISKVRYSFVKRLLKNILYDQTCKRFKLRTNINNNKLYA